MWALCIAVSLPFHYSVLLRNPMETSPTSVFKNQLHNFYFVRKAMNLSVIRVHSAWSRLLDLKPPSSLWEKVPCSSPCADCRRDKNNTAHSYFCSSLCKTLEVCCPRVLIFPILKACEENAPELELLKDNWRLPFEPNHPEIKSHTPVEGFQWISRNGTSQVPEFCVLESVERC